MMRLILDAFILLVPYYTGYYDAKNDGINFVIRALIFIITLALIDLKNYLNNK